MDRIRHEIQENMSPDQALEFLMEGNRRFVRGKSADIDLLEQVDLTSAGQFPIAAILGCIDSRTAAEIVFDQGIGDIFNIRLAGNIVNEDVLGSLEFACRISGTRLILVMGHTSCGAMISACNRVEMGNITPMIAKILPVIERFEDPCSDVDGVAAQNVLYSIERIRKESPILREMEIKGEIMIRGAMYDVSTGVVDLIPQ